MEEEQAGSARAQYGKKIIPALAEELKQSYGGYGRRNLAYYRKLYLSFPDIEILHTCVQNLSWSHIRLLTQLDEWLDIHGVTGKGTYYTFKGFTKGSSSKVSILMSHVEIPERFGHVF